MATKAGIRRRAAVCVGMDSGFRLRRESPTPAGESALPTIANQQPLAYVAYVMRLEDRPRQSIRVGVAGEPEPAGD